ncbi:hypothetical protein [Kitasatospora mediocidica]|uniref:hypothetical protein n=1 Tax=Kitasatospora mediocidica TaxID=58352 RepID=UPI00056105CC|nr:hypothetical protein [Kitasatospora mediocidica]
MNASHPEDDAYNARCHAHAQAHNEFTEANPDYNPWHATPDERVTYDTYANGRVAEILSRINS